jgi:hypothetical protein
MLRRLLVRWLPIMVLAWTCSLATAAPAAALTTACPAIHPRPAWCDSQTQPALASPKHVGWVYLNLNYCPPGMMCALVYRQSTQAWHWTGSRWTQRSINGGWVYVYPYTGEWRWAWTQQSGWVAISGHRFEIRHY